MTWNIRTGMGTDPQHHDQRDPVDLQRTVRVVAAVRPDLVALQEVDQYRDRTGFVDQPSVLAGLTGMNSAYGPILLDGAGECGLAVLTPHPIVHTVHNRFPIVHGWEPRGVLDVVVKVGNRPVQVLDTHLQVGFAGIDGDAGLQREDSARALVARMQRSSKPVELMGYFNADAGSPELALLSIARDAWTEKGDGRGTTIPASPFEEPQERIDAILVDGRLLVRECAVIRTAEMQLASDHYPVEGDLALVP